MKLSLRSIVTLALALSLVAGCASKPATPQQSGQSANQQPTQTTGQQAATGKEKVKLKFVVWTYATDVIQENIKKFEALNPEIEVELADYNWGQYNDTVVANFASGSPPDILYGSDHWLQQWAAAGWIVPLSDHFPEVKELAKDFAPYAVQGMTLDGKLYGVPYYADPMAFLYNAELLQQAGFRAAPKTWDEVLEQARAIKTKGIVQYPIGFGFSQQEPFSIETFTSMVFSRGGQLFDTRYEPLFTDSNGATAQTINWIRQALQEGLMNPESLQWDGVADSKAMQAGTQVFSINRASALADYNNPANSKYAGKFYLAPMPGSTGDTVGFVRFYAMSSAVPKRGKAALDAAWKFLKYFGGPGPDNTFPVVRRWALDKGLGFAQMPLFQDQEIRAAFGKWVDVSLLEMISKQQARAKDGLTPYYATWDVFVRAELQKAYLGRQSTDQTLQNMASKWKELKGRS